MPEVRLGGEPRRSTSTTRGPSMGGGQTNRWREVAPWGGWQSLMFLGMWLHHSDLCILLCVCISLLSLTRTLVIEIRVHLSNTG